MSDKCSHCDDPLNEVGEGPGGMCTRCGLCWYCEELATHWQEGTDRAHCDDCWDDITKSIRRQRNEELAEMKGDWLRDEGKDWKAK